MSRARRLSCRSYLRQAARTPTGGSRRPCRDPPHNDANRDIEHTPRTLVGEERRELGLEARGVPRLLRVDRDPLGLGRAACPNFQSLGAGRFDMAQTVGKDKQAWGLVLEKAHAAVAGGWPRCIGDRGYARRRG